MPDLMARLREISAKGDPAHQEQARLLIAALKVDAQDDAAAQSAALLINAYLHDPYLTR